MRAAGRATAHHVLVLQHACFVSDFPVARQARHDDVEELYAFSSARKMASVLLRAPGELMLYNKARRACPAGPSRGLKGAVQSVLLYSLHVKPAARQCCCSQHDITA
jgi:hypothetical protein